MNTYIHKTEKRLRVRSDYIRQNPEQVANLIEQLSEIEAIETIKHKRHAGSVAIHFEPKELDCESLLETLESHGWTQSLEKTSALENAVVKGTKTFAKGLAVLALKRAVSPTIGRVLFGAL